ncbi:hypothetical protein MGLY_25790 [Neomoorella glycerini]|uniref:DUF4125 domain-containing protein n=1 Tax=Neomoorella glycerini TaxID=55779 RepID=A0A6I5ZU12_9FIRM|nr:DUF4125 family protein [Moorella glycerini]QGP93178.1 hypothetical protein MGLY_25790 [Moorella glycerini]
MKKRELIKEILQIELEMFKQVRTAAPSRCQENTDSFLLVRGAAFANWSEQTLACYLQDLQEARQEGRNLMTEKYARMDNLIPCLNDNPLIDDIMAIEIEWEKEVRAKYPHVIGRPSGEGVETGDDMAYFKNYLRSELETYSDATLVSYYTDLLAAVGNNENLAEKTFATIFRRMGFASLAEAEAYLARKACG